METTTFEFRQLEAKDIAAMASILSKIGIKELKGCFQSVDIRGLAEKGNAEVLGVTIAIDAAGVILANYEKCQDDIFKFLASLSGKKKQEIETLSPAEFAEMVIAVVQKEEFKDFFTVVSKLFK